MQYKNFTMITIFRKSAQKWISCNEERVKICHNFTANNEKLRNFVKFALTLRASLVQG